MFSRRWRFFAEIGGGASPNSNKSQRRTNHLDGNGPEAGQLTPGKGNGGLDHFGFEVKDLEKTAEDLKKRGAKFSVEPISTATGSKYAFIDGPEGIRIELVERDSVEHI